MFNTIVCEYPVWYYYLVLDEPLRDKLTFGFRYGVVTSHQLLNLSICSCCREEQPLSREDFAAEGDALLDALLAEDSNAGVAHLASTACIAQPEPSPGAMDSHQGIEVAEVKLRRETNTPSLHWIFAVMNLLPRCGSSGICSACIESMSPV